MSLAFWESIKIQVVETAVGQGLVAIEYKGVGGLHHLYPRTVVTAKQYLFVTGFIAVDAHHHVGSAIASLQHSAHAALLSSS